MRSRLQTACFSAGAVIGLLVVSLQAQSAQTPVGSSQRTVVVAHPAQDLSGVWAYNADESVNAATGRPERPPRGPAGRAAAAAPPRVPTPPLSTPAPPPVAITRAGESTGTVPQDAFGFNRPGDVGPTVAMIQENRSLTRDLLEIPERLVIRVDSDAVTFVDDLDRMRIYPLTGERRRYQLGAARFNAETFWNESRLEKKIDAADGFRMTETYFLSETARRLFVILRVGSSRKGAPMMGVNRVYDRLDK